MEMKFKAWLENENMKPVLLDVLSIDFDEQGNVVSTHLRLPNGKYSKFYPNYNYGDKVDFVQYVGVKTFHGEEVYTGYTVRCFGGAYYQGVYEFDNTIKVGMTSECLMILANSDHLEIVNRGR